MSHCTWSSRSASVLSGLLAMRRWLLLLFIVLLSACGADTRGKKPLMPTEPADVPTLLSQHGKVLLNEPFTTPAWSKTMGSYKADLELSDGHLRVTPETGAGHAPQINLFAPMTNLVVQVRFRLDGAKWANVQVSDPKRKENLACVSVDAQRVSMSRITGWGKTTKLTNLGTKPITGEPTAWHMLVVEWCGNECLAHLDGRVVLYGESEQFGMVKGQLSFNSSGGSVWYDDVRVWEGVPDPAWAKRKAEVLTALPR